MSEDHQDQLEKIQQDQAKHMEQEEGRFDHDHVEGNDFARDAKFQRKRRRQDGGADEEGLNSDVDGKTTNTIFGHFNFACRGIQN